MTEEIINSDGSRNWQANILLDNIKRLEQENKKLKRDNKRMKAIFDGCGLEENGDCTYCNVDKAYHELEQENKELKEINTALIQEAEDIAEARMEICNQCGNRDDYNIPCKMIRDLDYGLNITIEERDTYRSALEEIREKLKYWETYFCDNCPFQNKDACDKNEKDDIGENTCTSVHFIKIQNKINEVLNKN